MLDDEISDYELLTIICTALARSDEFVHKLSEWLARNSPFPDLSRACDAVKSEDWPLIWISFGALGDFEQTFIFDHVDAKDLYRLSSWCDSQLDANG
jgi:hypothetical protein